MFWLQFLFHFRLMYTHFERHNILLVIMHQLANVNDMLRCRWTHFLSSGASRRKDYPWQFKNSNAQLCIVSIISSPIKSYSKLHSIHFFPKYFVSESIEGIVDSHKSSYILSLAVFQSEKSSRSPRKLLYVEEYKAQVFHIF